MNNEITLLALTAASIGFFHTLLGPDHYLPFIVMSKARKWPLVKTMSITFLCGIGHVLGSVILGIIGVSIGLAIHRIEVFESLRGNLAGWILMSFGLVYMIWGIRNTKRNKQHYHLHQHPEGIKHEHKHDHQNEHSHAHNSSQKNITPWVLFTVFVLGPCEPLIPILMYPAAQASIFGLIFITVIFAVVTISTMMLVVYLASLGLQLIIFKKLEKYAHALAGGFILLSGGAINFLGL
ncbi:MAG: sulfite exporter TauE/SafE family protein [Candidatus Cloacimonetes bacterium]|nr:sulfite exporter TauE/SafE family protein [Candidatus Cloacimonadota bacterium]